MFLLFRESSIHLFQKLDNKPKIAKTLVAGPSFCHRIAGMTPDAI